MEPYVNCIDQISAKRGTDLKFETEANLKALFPKSKQSLIMLWGKFLIFYK